MHQLHFNFLTFKYCYFYSTFSIPDSSRENLVKPQSWHIHHRLQTCKGDTLPFVGGCVSLLPYHLRCEQMACTTQKKGKIKTATIVSQNVRSFKSDLRNEDIFASMNQRKICSIDVEIFMITYRMSSAIIPVGFSPRLLP